jgi:hypothetical protein
MTTGISGETCQRGLCTLEAEYCAALTDSHGEVVSHLFLCENDAQEMFSLNVDQLARRVEPKTRLLLRYHPTFDNDPPFDEKKGDK